MHKQTWINLKYSVIKVVKIRHFRSCRHQFYKTNDKINELIKHLLAIIIKEQNQKLYFFVDDYGRII